jgi:hypothetical protein
MLSFILLILLLVSFCFSQHVRNSSIDECHQKLIDSMFETAEEVVHYWNCSPENSGICFPFNKTGEEKTYDCCVNKDSLDMNIRRFKGIKECDQKAIDEQIVYVKQRIEPLMKGCPEHNRDVCEKLRSVRSNVTITTTQSPNHSFGVTTNLSLHLMALILIAVHILKAMI